MDKIYNMVDIETIETLAKIVKDNELGEITITDGGKTITVKGKKYTPVSLPPAVNTPALQNIPAQSSDLEKVPVSSSGKVIKSPIVGTYYSSPAPGKPPFISVGKTVNKGDVILIIESMKMMNEVVSEFEGVVREILVNNGDSVDYDQPLVIID